MVFIHLAVFAFPNAPIVCLILHIRHAFHSGALFHIVARGPELCPVLDQYGESHYKHSFPCLMAA